jgi:hypothetical protein
MQVHCYTRAVAGGVGFRRVCELVHIFLGLCLACLTTARRVLLCGVLALTARVS